MNEVKAITDAAAAHDDRWLFLAMVVVFILTMLAVYRWIVADREKVAQRLTLVTDRYIATAEHIAEVVANNTIVMAEVRDTIAWCKERREK